MLRHLLAALTIAMVLGVGIVAWLLLIPGRAESEAGTPGIAREDFVVDFGDFRAKAQLTYPEIGVAPFPVVLLVAGSGPADLDATISGPDGKPSSRLLRDISDALTRRGYATVRYNKHYVKSATDHPDAADYGGKVSLRQLQSDFERVYATIRADSRLDPSRTIVYGWSEGALIATGAALAHPEIAGLILHAPPAGTYQDLARYQWLELGLSFLREVADSDHDGYLTSAELVAVREQAVSVALRPLFPLLLESSWLGGTRIRPSLDLDRDGRLALWDEVGLPLSQYLDRWNVAHAENGYEPYTTTGQPMPIAQRLADYTGPILLLHGENDGSVAAADSRRIAAVLTAAGHSDHTLRGYPDLGHTLGPATDRYHDGYAPISPAVLGDVADWLDQRYRR